MSKKVFKRRAQVIPDEDTRSPLRAVTIGHDRSTDSEILALGLVLHRAQTLVGAEGKIAEVRGQVQIYVNDIPCLSCIGAFAQLRNWMPDLEIFLSFKPGPASRGGRKKLGS